MDKSTRVLIGVFCVVKLCILLIADSYSGFQGDELLHIESGNHLAWGYMEYPPMIGFLAFLQNILQSDSVFVHRFFAHAACLGIYIYVGKITWELGGRRKAVFLVLLTLLGIMGRSHLLFQPVVFSQFFWVLSFYFLTLYVKNKRKKDLWWLTLALSLGFLTKYDLFFFMMALPILFFYPTIRKVLIEHKFYLNILVFLLIISPNLLWQIQNNFPVFQMFDRLYETQLHQLTFTEVFLQLIISMNPFSMLIWVPAIGVLFLKKDHPWRPLGFFILTSTVLLTVAKGKSYYFYPIFLTLLPFGAWLWEQILVKRKSVWLYPLAGVLAISGWILLPFTIPLTSLESYLKHEYPYDPKEVEGGKHGVKEERYSKEMWPEILKELEEVYAQFSAEEQANTYIWGKHYSQAGAINLLRNPKSLPEAFSLHGSFYSWIPQGNMPEKMLLLRYSDSTGSTFFNPYFEEVIQVKTIYNPYADKEERLWQTIFIAQGPKQDFQTLQKLFAKRIFE